MSGPVLVVGGTGKTGGPLVRRLHAEGWRVRSASRAGVAPDGVEGVRFDWNDPATHDAAFDGVGRIFLIAPIGSMRPLEVMEPFVERALARGVVRFVLLSSSLIEEGGPAMGAVHALLRRCAPEWVVLRPSWFMQNFTTDPHRSTIRDEGAIYSATGDGLVPFIAVDDIAEVALHALTDERAPDHDLLITGPTALSYGEVAELIGAARGGPVRHVRLTVADLATRFERVGIPAGFAAMLAGLDGAIAAGAEARTTTVVADVTGRAPTTFERFAARHADAWR